MGMGWHSTLGRSRVRALQGSETAECARAATKFGAHLAHRNWLGATRPARGAAREVRTAQLHVAREATARARASIATARLLREGERDQMAVAVPTDAEK